MKILIIFLSICCIFICKLISKEFRNPATFYTIFWVIFCIIPSCILWTDIKWDYNGILWILCSCLFTIIGQILIFNNKKNNDIVEQNYNCEKIKNNYNIKKMKFAIKIMLVISLVYVIKSLYNKGFSFSVFLKLDNLIAINNMSATNRYSGSGAVSILNQIILIIQYTLPLIGGFSISFFKKRSEKILAMSSLLPVFLSFIVSNAKAGFIACVMYYIIAYFVGFYVCNGYSKKISRKLIKRLIIFGIIFIVLLFISMCLRIGNFDKNTMKYVKNKFLLYLFGSIRAFDEWTTNYQFKTIGDYTMGSTTYWWFFNLIGLKSRVQGVYGWATSIRTNVFTVFRGIITDFGMIGGLIYCLIKGMVASYLYRKFHNAEKIKPLLITLICSTYVFILFGLFVSLWTYTTFFASFVLFYIILVFCLEKGNNYAK